MVRELLKRGASVDLQTSLGITALNRSKYLFKSLGAIEGFVEHELQIGNKLQAKNLTQFAFDKPGGGVKTRNRGFSLGFFSIR